MSNLIRDLLGFDLIPDGPADYWGHDLSGIAQAGAKPDLAQLRGMMNAYAPSREWKLISVMENWHLTGSGRLDIYDNGHETVIHIGDRTQPCLFTQDWRFRLEAL